MFFLLIISLFSLFFFFNDPATTEIYTLSLHDALPIWNFKIEWLDLQRELGLRLKMNGFDSERPRRRDIHSNIDRKSTRLNSSHPSISYAVFCLKKKKKQQLNHNCRSNIILKH